MPIYQKHNTTQHRTHRMCGITYLSNAFTDASAISLSAMAQKQLTTSLYAYHTKHVNRGHQEWAPLDHYGNTRNSVRRTNTPRPPDQTRPDQTRPDQTRPDPQTRP